MQTRRLLFKLNAATSEEEDSLPGPWTGVACPFYRGGSWRLSVEEEWDFSRFFSFSSCCSARTLSLLLMDGHDGCSSIIVISWGFSFLGGGLDWLSMENDEDLLLERRFCIGFS